MSGDPTRIGRFRRLLASKADLAYTSLCYECGRTVSFGAPSDGQIKAHRLVMESQRIGIEALTAGFRELIVVDR
jgi:Xaa-Pro aminopeptidase